MLLELLKSNLIKTNIPFLRFISSLSWNNPPKWPAVLVQALGEEEQLLKLMTTISWLIIHHSSCFHCDQGFHVFDVFDSLSFVCPSLVAVF